MRSPFILGILFFATTSGVAAQSPSIKVDLKTEVLAPGTYALLEVGITGVSSVAELGVYFGLPSASESLVVLGGQPFAVPIVAPALLVHSPAIEGRTLVAFQVPADPSLVGLKAYVQAVVLDGFSLTLARPVLTGPIIEDSIQ